MSSVRSATMSVPGHRRMAREVVGAEQPALLGRHEQEQDGAPRPRRQRRIGARHVEHDRDARGVVVRAVVDIVAVHRHAAPEVVHVGDVDDVFVLEGGVAALEARHQVGTLDVLVGRARRERHAGRQVERLRRALRRRREDLGRRLRRPGKERLDAGMVEGGRPAQRRVAPVGFPLRVDPGVAALLAGGDAHVPAESRIVGRREADRADRAALDRLGLLHRPRRVVRALVARQHRRRAAQVRHHLVLHVRARCRSRRSRAPGR